MKMPRHTRQNVKTTQNLEYQAAKSKNHVRNVRDNPRLREDKFRELDYKLPETPEAKERRLALKDSKVREIVRRNRNRVKRDPSACDTRDPRMVKLELELQKTYPVPEQVLKLRARGFNVEYELRPVLVSTDPEVAGSYSNAMNRRTRLIERGYTVFITRINGIAKHYIDKWPRKTKEEFYKSGVISLSQDVRLHPGGPAYSSDVAGDGPWGPVPPVIVQPISVEFSIWYMENTPWGVVTTVVTVRLFGPTFSSDNSGDGPEGDLIWCVLKLAGVVHGIVGAWGAHMFGPGYSSDNAGDGPIQLYPGLAPPIPDGTVMIRLSNIRPHECWTPSGLGFVHERNGLFGEVISDQGIKYDNCFSEIFSARGAPNDMAHTLGQLGYITFDATGVETIAMDPFTTMTVLRSGQPVEVIVPTVVRSLINTLRSRVRSPNLQNLALSDLRKWCPGIDRTQYLNDSLEVILYELLAPKVKPLVEDVVEDNRVEHRVSNECMLYTPISRFAATEAPHQVFTAKKRLFRVTSNAPGRFRYVFPNPQAQRPSTIEVPARLDPTHGKWLITSLGGFFSLRRVFFTQYNNSINNMASALKRLLACREFNSHEVPNRHIPAGEPAELEYRSNQFSTFLPFINENPELLTYANMEVPNVVGRGLEPGDHVVLTRTERPANGPRPALPPFNLVVQASPIAQGLHAFFKSREFGWYDKLLLYASNYKKWAYTRFVEMYLFSLRWYDRVMHTCGLSHPKRDERERFYEDMRNRLYGPSQLLNGANLYLKDELAKPRKAARLFGSFGQSTILELAGPEMAKKLVIGTHDLSRYIPTISRSRITIAESTDIGYVTAAFKNLETDLTLGFKSSLIFSDDSVIVCTCRDGSHFMANIDVSSNDSSNDVGPFSVCYALHKSMFPSTAVYLFKLLTLPMKLTNPYGVGVERITFTPATVFESSGHVWTTLVNHVASFSGHAMVHHLMSEHQPDNPEEAERMIRAGFASIGHEVTVEVCDCWADLQFLKRSPMMTYTGERIAALNYGAIFRSLGKIHGELTPVMLNLSTTEFSKLSLEERADIYMNGVLLGYKHEPGSIIMDALRARFVKTNIHQIHVERSYLAREEREPYHRHAYMQKHVLTPDGLTARYGCDYNELVKLAVYIENFTYGQEIATLALSRFYAKDYGLE